MFNFLICLRQAQTDIRKVHTNIRKVHTNIRKVHTSIRKVHTDIRLAQYKRDRSFITLRKLRFFEIQKRLLLNPKHNE